MNEPDRLNLRSGAEKHLLTYGPSSYSTVFVEDDIEGFAGLDLYKSVDTPGYETRLRIARVVFWDACGQFFLETYSTDIALPIVEELIKEAKTTMVEGQRKYQDQYVTQVTPNPNPILDQGVVPEFQLAMSRLGRDDSISPPREEIVELWVKTGSGHGTFMKIELYPLSSQSEARQAVERVYCSRNPHQPLNLPVPGSYSGHPVGDFCWSYRHSPDSGSRAIVAVQGSCLFRVLLTNPQTGVDVTLTETVARTVAERLKEWPRPL